MMEDGVGKCDSSVWPKNIHKHQKLWLKFAEFCADELATLAIETAPIQK